MRFLPRRSPCSSQLPTGPKAGMGHPRPLSSLPLPRSPSGKWWRQSGQEAPGWGSRETARRKPDLKGARRWGQVERQGRREARGPRRHSTGRFGDKEL